jgi:hypothetical protein
MKIHNRFDEDHREACQVCYDAYLDFMSEQRAEQELDAMIELDTAGVI